MSTAKEAPAKKNRGTILNNSQLSGKGTSPMQTRGRQLQQAKGGADSRCSSAYTQKTVARKIIWATLDNSNWQCCNGPENYHQKRKQKGWP
jgi:hypothetical protein